MKRGRVDVTNNSGHRVIEEFSATGCQRLFEHVEVNNAEYAKALMDLTKAMVARANEFSDKTGRRYSLTVLVNLESLPWHDR